MITDSKNISWSPNGDRSIWIASNGLRLIVNPASTDEQVLSAIEQSYIPAPLEKTDAERIAELESQLAAVLAKLS